MNICDNWDANQYGYIRFEPGAEAEEAHRAWQGCPTVAVTRRGRLFAGWYTGGAFEPCIHNHNVLVKSDDGGESWSSPLLTVHSDYEKRLRKIDIQLWVNSENHLWLMWTVSPYYETSKPASVRAFVNGEQLDYHREFLYTEVMVCKDPDAEDLIWEEPRYLCDGFTRHQPIMTSNGRIIVPAYGYDREDYTIYLSDDKGRSFTVSSAGGKLRKGVYDEIGVYEKSKNHLCFLARTNRGFYVSGESFDDGDHWTPAEKFEDAPSTRFYIGRLKNSMVAYVRNVSNTARKGMKICLSEDDGRSFSFQMVLDDREDLSYPDLAEDSQGNIYIVYDRERDNRNKLNVETWESKAAKEILLCKITTEDIMRGELSETSFTQRIVSKARINTVDF